MSLRYPQVIQEMDRATTMKEQSHNSTLERQYTPRTAQLMGAQKEIWQERSLSHSLTKNDMSHAHQSRTLNASFDGRDAYRQVETAEFPSVQSMSQGLQQVPDFNSVDFMSDAMSLDISELALLLARDDVKCTNEDQVVNFVVEYVRDKPDDNSAFDLFRYVRYDHLSTEKLIELSQNQALPQADIVRAMCKRLAQTSTKSTIIDNAKQEDRPRRYKEPVHDNSGEASADEVRAPARMKIKVVNKSKKAATAKKKESLVDSEDSFDRGENPKRNVMTTAIVKSETTLSYYMIMLNYVMIGDKYLLTLKDTTKKTFLCKKQEIPRDFVVYGVEVDDLEDESAVMRTLKSRLSDIIREEADEIEQVSPKKISQEIFKNPAKRGNKVTTAVKVTRTNDQNAQASSLHDRMSYGVNNMLGQAQRQKQGHPQMALAQDQQFKIQPSSPSMFESGKGRGAQNHHHQQTQHQHQQPGHRQTQQMQESSSPTLYERMQKGAQHQYDRTNLKMMKEKADKLIAGEREKKISQNQFEYTLDEPQVEPPLERMTREELIDYIKKGQPSSRSNQQQQQRSAQGRGQSASSRDPMHNPSSQQYTQARLQTPVQQGLPRASRSQAGFSRSAYHENENSQQRANRYAGEEKQPMSESQQARNRYVSPYSQSNLKQGSQKHAQMTNDRNGDQNDFNDSLQRQFNRNCQDADLQIGEMSLRNQSNNSNQLRSISPATQQLMLQQNNQAAQSTLVAGMMTQQPSLDYMRGHADQLLSGQMAAASQQQPRGTYTTPRSAPDIYTAVPEEFVYEASSQEGGALHYLGTLGYSQAWANPDCQRKQVRSFASSLNHGRPSDVVGLQTPESFSTTGNAPFSFFGVQLMFGRRLLPTSYTIRNLALMQEGYIMTSWRFEASNDLVNWVTLDARYGHLHNQEAFSAICKPGGVTTWGVDGAIFRTRLGMNGYSAFRVVQIDQNTGQTHTMNLAGLEIFGKPTNPELWTF